jgi:hypothetical protein
MTGETTPQKLAAWPEADRPAIIVSGAADLVRLLGML